MLLRHRIVILAGVVLVLLAAAAFLCFGRQRIGRVSFPAALGVPPSQIVKVDVRTDWGTRATITSESQIREMTAVLGSCSYRKIADHPPFSGYLYGMTFYTKSGKTASMTLVDDPIISDKTYTVSGTLDTKKLESVVGLYPPS